MKVYLDYAATTPLDEEVFEGMLPYFKGEFGNPDSLHAYGRSAAYAVECARDEIAAILGVSPAEVYFTSGGTEADNQAARCFGRGRAAVSAIEHAAVLEGVKLREGGYAVIPANEGGIITPERVEEGLTSDMGALFVMAVNNETGCIQPIPALSALCKNKGVLLFSDCVQAAGTQDLKAIVSACDGISLSAHKLYGPKGAGAIIVKKGVPFSALIAGGEQERGKRGGTTFVAGAVGLALALKKAQAHVLQNSAYLSKLRDTFEERVLCALKGEVKADGICRAPNISHLTFARGGTALLSRLDLAGVACSGGAACSSHSALPSHVMLAMGRSEEEARRGLRFSFGLPATEEEVLFAAQTVIECYNAIV